jgi:hypothetical protein
LKREAADSSEMLAHIYLTTCPEGYNFLYSLLHIPFSHKDLTYKGHQVPSLIKLWDLIKENVKRINA